jgi:hypothetical protein
VLLLDAAAEILKRGQRAEGRGGIGRLGDDWIEMKFRGVPGSVVCARTCIHSTTCSYYC